MKIWEVACLLMLCLHCLYSSTSLSPSSFVGFVPTATLT